MLYLNLELKFISEFTLKLCFFSSLKSAAGLETLGRSCQFPVAVCTANEAAAPNAYLVRHMAMPACVLYARIDCKVPC